MASHFLSSVVIKSFLRLLFFYAFFRRFGLADSYSVLLFPWPNLRLKAWSL